MAIAAGGGSGTAITGGGSRMIHQTAPPLTASTARNDRLHLIVSSRMDCRNCPRCQSAKDKGGLSTASPCPCTMSVVLLTALFQMWQKLHCRAARALNLLHCLLPALAS